MKKIVSTLLMVFSLSTLTFSQAYSAVALPRNGAKGSYHSNGGGFVANTATVSSSAYIGPTAQVCHGALVYGNAKVWFLEISLSRSICAEAERRTSLQICGACLI